MTDSIAALLRQWREERGLSQGGLGRKAGVSTSTLSRWEAGRRQPSMPELQRVLEALRVPAPQRLRALQAVQAPRALLSVHESAGDRPPVTGDLLRALRLRRGRTQAQVASLIGATQGMLAKWERSEDWPCAQRLHALCLVLHAHPQEVAALTCGRLWLAGEGEPEPTSADRVYWSAGPLSPLRDLRFLALEARLWELSRGRPSVLSWLCNAYCFHARALRDAGRFAEVAPYAHRALSLARQGHGGEEDRWCWAMIAAAAAQAQGGRLRHLRSAARLLREGLAAVQAPSNRAWTMSELATYLARQGREQAAVRVSAAACALAARAAGDEALFRWRDHARILAHLGRHGEALDALERAWPLADKYADALVRNRLLEAECLWAVGERSAAQACLSTAVNAVAAEGLSYLRPVVQALAPAIFDAPPAGVL